MIKDWKELFRPHILERGWNYYEEGAVFSLEETENGYAATVAGSEDYEVEIELSGDRVQAMFCDCPYAEDGNYCKHMAAVLYEIEENEAAGQKNAEHETAEYREGASGTGVPVKSREKRAEENRKELEEIVNKIPEKEVRKILLELAWEDEALGSRIQMQYSDTISPGQMISLKREIDGIAYRYSDRSGFIDYYHAFDYVSELQDFLYGKLPILIDQQYYMQAFELVNYLFYSVGNQAVDDSDGGTGLIADGCYECWKKILEQCSKEERNQMFQWFQSHRKGYVIDYMEEYIEDFLMNEFHDPELLQQKLRALDKQIEKAEKQRADGETGSESGYLSDYGLAKHASDRQRYKELVQYLKKIAKYPGGWEKAGRIAAEWKSLYKRRPAMMDELKKGGF